MHIKALIPDFITPTKGTEHSAGFDLYPPTSGVVQHALVTKLPLGFACEIPVGWVGLLLPRSGTGIKGLEIVNSTGVIDADYRGEVTAFLTLKAGFPPLNYSPEKPIVQLVLVPAYPGTVTLVDELSETGRGAGGFGSTTK